MLTRRHKFDEEKWRKFIFFFRIRIFKSEKSWQPIQSRKVKKRKILSLWKPATIKNGIHVRRRLTTDCLKIFSKLFEIIRTLRIDWLFEKLFEIIRTLRIMTDCSKNVQNDLNSSQKCLAVSFWQFGSWLFKILRTVLRIDLLLSFVGWEAKFRCVSNYFSQSRVSLVLLFDQNVLTNSKQLLTPLLTMYFKFKLQHFYASDRYKVSLVQLICD